MSYTKKVLKNNTRLITVPMGDTKTATLLVMCRIGSRYETKRINGVSHFVEHLMFKGTKKRPTTLHLSKELDGVGAEFNAFTGKDYTGYYIKADGRHLSLAIDVLSDMLLNSKFEAAEIEREKGVIVEEINMYEDNPIMYVEELLEQEMFSGNQLGWSIAGTRETVRGLTRDDLVGYRDKYYRGANMVIGLGGQFTDEHLKQLEASFSFTKSTSQSKFTPITIDQKKPRVHLYFKETEQTQLALGFPAYSYTDKRMPALQLLSVILGGNMSSRLFLKVRERNSLAYYIRSSVTNYQDTGALVIQSGLDKTRIDKAIKLIMQEVKKITTGVTAAELSRAKEYVAGKNALHLEDSSSMTQWYVGQELLTNSIETPDKKLQKIMAVTREDVARVATDVLRSHKASLAVIGPFKDKERFLSLLG
jgi:predicted Zn-dependent peptidase